MGRWLQLAILALVLATGAQAQSGDESEAVFPQRLGAGQLLGYCAASSLTPTGRERRRYCAGFVSGVEETLRLSAGAAPVACPPANLSAARLADSFKRQASRDRDLLQRPAAEAVRLALERAFPCATAPSAPQNLR